MAYSSHLQEEQSDRSRKSAILAIAIGILYAFLFIRLFYLQIIELDLNTRLSNENAMRQKIIQAPRGRIYDRNGIMLARNRPSYSICVLPYKMPRKAAQRAVVIDRLCQIHNYNGDSVFTRADLTYKINFAMMRRFDETRIKEDVSLDVMSIIEEHALELPGIVVETESRREYPYGKSLFHAIGYMGEIPEAQFDSLKNHGYFYGDLFGKSGLEKKYEKEFRGIPGQEYIEVNAFGKRLGAINTLKRIEAVPGDDMYLSIDINLQQIAAAAFPDTFKGAAVVIDPRTGGILALYSSPSADPNIFSLAASLRNKNWAKIALDPSLPLNNRATSGTYAPGSTFKLVSAAAGLATEKLTATSRMPHSCSGAFRIGKRVAHCWKLDGHGSLPLINAVQQSCNVYFYQVGLFVGDVAINKYATMFGLGKATGIDLPQEKSGWISGEDAYNERFKKRGWVWTRGLVLDLAIGQTQLVTPIQLANMISGIGNGDAIYRPSLMQRMVGPKGKITRIHKPEVLSKITLTPEVIATLHDAIRNVIEPGGTGGAARVEHVPVGGKTGSSQNPQGLKTHALFVGCAPVDTPVIAVAVVVENAGHGGSIAAPIAGQLLRYYFANTEEGKRITAQYIERENMAKEAKGN